MTLRLLSDELARPGQPPLELHPLRNWPKTWHVFDEPSIWAVNAALLAGRPLLLRGEPGSGKSQLARAVAQQLKRPFLSRVINGRVEPEDLLYRFDAVARLAAAQMARSTATVDAKSLDAANFLLPDVLWWAFNPTTAQKKFETAAPHCGEVGCCYGEETGFPIDDPQGVVVLIDEIDKADSEVPNSLLETLSLDGFQLPHGGGTVKVEHARPLVIITTNEDRELPPAFLRRCFVHQMDLPSEATELATHLTLRVYAHFTEKQVPLAVASAAIKQLTKDREEMKSLDLPPPGQAELLDLLRAVAQIGLNADDQLAALEKIRQCAFRKHRPG